MKILLAFSIVIIIYSIYTFLNILPYYSKFTQFQIGILTGASIFFIIGIFLLIYSLKKLNKRNDKKGCKS
jgi:uncharacterized membrane protein